MPVETEYGHVLVFGVTPELQQAFDFGNIHLALADVITACEAHGAVAVPCHPGRKRVGMAALEEFGVPEGVRIVEVFNGGSRDDEDGVSQRMADELGYNGTGGSDAHRQSYRSLRDEFEQPIHNEQELVAAPKWRFQGN